MTTNRRITYRFGEGGKLIRPGKLERMEQDGQEPVSRQVAGDEHIEYVLRKFVEEIGEITSGGNTEEELGDLLQAVEDLAWLLGHSMVGVAQAKERKQRLYGDFTNGVVIETVTVTEGDEWHARYSARPDLFIEVEPVNEY